MHLVWNAIAGGLLLISIGALFSGRFRAQWLLVFLAGMIAMASASYVFESVITTGGRVAVAVQTPNPPAKPAATAAPRPPAAGPQIATAPPSDLVFPLAPKPREWPASHFRHHPVHHVRHHRHRRRLPIRRPAAATPPPAPAAPPVPDNAPPGTPRICTEPTPPEAPDGAAATHAEMVAAHDATVMFIKTSDDYQSCLLRNLNDARLAAQKANVEIDPALGQATDDKLKANQALKEKVGAAFNMALQAYDAKHQN